jgi:hypothetical protein
MDYHLQNLRTGESLTLDPRRTLIGVADHATVRTAAGPFLAVLAVHYPAGWAVHGLSDDPAVSFNGEPLGVARQADLRPGDLLEVAGDRFRFAADRDPDPPLRPDPPPACFAYIHNPDGMEECRAVDHDLLFGRLAVCHVRLLDTRLSRLTALLAAHAGSWYVHNLSKRPVVARNRELVDGFAPVADGDELLVGPLVVRVEIRDPNPDEQRPVARFAPADDPSRPAGTDDEERSATDHVPVATLETARPRAPEPPADLTALRDGGQKLERWLKDYNPTPAPQGGIGGWLSAQRERLTRFWYDTPETTAARALRTAGRAAEAFALLDRAIRARPDSPELLRELYRLYEAAGLTDLCYRPLRQIEKLAAARGRSDQWVLETLARLCERLSRHRPDMFEKAMRYWEKLEEATGVSYARERAAAGARRTLREGGFTRADHDGV